MHEFTRTELKHIAVAMRVVAENMEEDGRPLPMHYAEMYRDISKKAQAIADSDAKRITIK